MFCTLWWTQVFFHHPAVLSQACSLQWQFLLCIAKVGWSLLYVYCKGWRIFTLCVLQRLDHLYSMCIAKVGGSLLYMYFKGWRIFTLFVLQWFIKLQLLLQILICVYFEFLWTAVHTILQWLVSPKVHVATTW